MSTRRPANRLLNLEIGRKYRCLNKHNGMELNATVMAVSETRATLEWFDGSETELSIFSDVERTGDRLVFN